MISESVILDEEFVAFKVVPDIYSSFYLGYLLGKINSDVQNNYHDIDKKFIESHAERSCNIIQYIGDNWMADHLQNIDASINDHPIVIQYNELTLYCSLVDESIIRGILGKNSKKTSHQLKTIFSESGYVLIKVLNNNYIVMSSTAYKHYLTE